MDSEKRQQLELPMLPEREAHVEPVTPELIRMIRRQPTFLGAWNLAQDWSGLEDKQVYVPLKIDSSHWSKIRKGDASPPADGRFVRYLDTVRNEIPLIWLAEYRGYDWMSIRKHLSSEQQHIEALQTENRDLRKLVRLQAEILKGKG